MQYYGVPMNKLYYLLGIVFILSLVSCYADGMIAQVNNQTTFMSSFESQGLLTDAETITTTFYYENTTLLVGPSAMFRISQGLYGYNYTPNVTGKFVRTTNILYLGNYYDSAEDILVVTNINDISQDTVEVLNMAFETIFLFIIGLALAWLAKYLQINWLYFFSGTWFIIMSTYLIFTGFANYSYTFFTLLGFGIIVYGVQELNKQSALDKKRKLEEDID